MVRKYLAAVALLAVCSTAVGTIADEVLVFLARVGCQGKGHAVGLPQIHLGAARAHLADTTVLIRGRGLPVGVALGEECQPYERSDIGECGHLPCHRSTSSHEHTGSRSSRYHTWHQPCS